MDNSIAIGDLLRLDRRTRTLSHTQDGKNLLLPASACRCLAALAEAKEQVLSQEQLMDIGWRHAGVEVTDNSVRVMITKIRRALIDLKVEDRVQLIAVTRSGYRLIVRAEQPVATSAARRSSEAASTEQATAGVASGHTITARMRTLLKRPVSAGLAGLLLGCCAVLLTSGLLTVKPLPVHFIRWYGAEVPAQSEVWVAENAQPEKAQVVLTLQLYTQYALNRDPDIHAEHARYLYITSGRSSPHPGLIACVTPLRDSENNCESYSFTYR